MTDAAGAHCSSLLRARDEDRWLAAQYAPPALRRRLVALYAFQSELRRVPQAVSEPPLGEIRLQWHREALQEIRDGKPPRRQPIVEEMAAAGLADEAYEKALADAVDAAARPLYGEGFSSVDDLFAWLEKADGSFDVIAVRLAGGDKTLAAAAARAGAAFAAAREGRALAPALADQVAPRASAVWDEEKQALAAAPSSCIAAVAHLFLTRTYLKRGKRAFPIAKRLRLFTAVAFGR